MGGLDVAGGARLHFEEAQNLSFPADQIDFPATPK
jgi:hypothetical protein